MDDRIPHVVIHRGPPLHPDDVTTVDGIPVTSPSRTLIHLAEVVTADELRACFARAREIGLLDPEALCALARASRVAPVAGDARRGHRRVPPLSGRRRIPAAPHV